MGFEDTWKFTVHPTRFSVCRSSSYKNHALARRQERRTLSFVLLAFLSCLAFVRANPLARDPSTHPLMTQAKQNKERFIHRRGPELVSYFFAPPPLTLILLKQRNDERPPLFLYFYLSLYPPLSYTFLHLLLSFSRLSLRGVWG